MRRLRELGLDELIRERAERGRPGDRPRASGMQLLFEGSDEFGAAEGLGLLRGDVRPLDAPGSKLPHIGWNEVRFERDDAADAGLPDAEAYYHVHSLRARAQPTDATSASATTAASSSRSRRATTSSAASSIPEKSSHAGLAPAARASPQLCATGARMILYPAIDISEGKAVRLVKGDFDAKTVYDDDPLDAARAWVERGRALPARRRPRRRARRQPAEPRTTSSGSRTSCSVPVQYGGGLRSLLRRPRRAARRRRARHPRHRGAHRRRLPRRRPRLVPRADHRLGRHARRQRLDVGLAGDDADAGRRRDRAAAAPRRALVRLHQRRQGRDARGPDLDEVRRIAAVVRGRFLYSGGIGALEDLARRSPRCARSTSAA